MTALPPKLKNTLSAQNFILALSGAKVKDEGRNEVDFFHSKITIDRDEYEEVIVVDGINVVEPVIITKEHLEKEGIALNYPILIRNSHFQSVFSISNLELQGQFLILTNTLFFSMFYAANTKFIGGLEIKGGVFAEDIYIERCSFIKNFEVKKGDFKGVFYLSKILSQSVFQVSGGIFHRELKISQCKFYDEFSISAGEFKKVCNIFRNSFAKLFWLINGKFWKQLKVRRNIFYGDLTISGGIFKDGVHLLENDLHIGFKVLSGSYEKKFHIEKCVFYCNITISGGFFKKVLHFHEGEFEGLFLIDVGVKKKGNIHHLYFDLSSFIKSKVIVEKGTNINRLTFTRGIAPSGMVYIDSIKADQIVFSNFVNEGILELTGISGVSHSGKKSILYFTNSNLDNVVFKGVNFNSFGLIGIENTKLNKISIIGRHFPASNITLSKIVRKNKIKPQLASKVAEIYNQLYLAMKAQGNRYWELQYYSYYLEWQRKATKKWWHQIPFILHKYTTYYDTQWYLALVWILMFGLVFYLFYIDNLLTQGVLSKSLDYHLKYYFQFLLPTHKVRFVQDVKLTAFSVTIDFAWRILSGYFIYQMIAAFRRFGRK